MRKIFFVMIFIFNTCVYAEDLPLHLLKLPPGFHITIYASIENARSLALGKNGIVFVGSRDAGKVYAIVPAKNEKDKPTVLTIISGLTMPNGIAYYKGDLYVAAVDRILRYKNIDDHLANPGTPILITGSLPNKSHHGWRYIHFGPDGKLYIGIGAPCNACLSEDHRFATIMRMDANGSNQEIYAHGVRNTVGFAWHPRTHQLWFTDNGRDWLGDDAPPDELNHVTKSGQHFGYPYCHGNDQRDPVYGKAFSCTGFIPPDLELQAHVAALGMIFYTGNMFPAEYVDQIFIAQHGSWNRSKKIGYNVMSVKLNNDKIEAKPFITGWLDDSKVWGRPVDLLQMPNGSLLISDDYANVVYQVTYKK